MYFGKRIFSNMPTFCTVSLSVITPKPDKNTENANKLIEIGYTNLFSIQTIEENKSIYPRLVYPEYFQRFDSLYFQHSLTRLPEWLYPSPKRCVPLVLVWSICYLSFGFPVILSLEQALYHWYRSVDFVIVSFSLSFFVLCSCSVLNFWWLSARHYCHYSHWTKFYECIRK